MTAQPHDHLPPPADAAARSRFPRRRTRLAATAVLAVGALTLAGCGADDPTTPASGSAPLVVPSAAPTDPSTVTPSATASPSDDASPSATASPSDDASPSATSGGDDGEDARAPQPVATMTDTRAEVDADDQSGDGRRVRLGEVVLSDGDGFVAVFDASGRLLGAAPVSRSTRPAAVPLDVPVTGTTNLVAVLYADDGDGRFEADVDAMVVDGDGEPVDEDLTYRVR